MRKDRTHPGLSTGLHPQPPLSQILFLTYLFLFFFLFFLFLFFHPFSLSSFSFFFIFLTVFRVSRNSINYLERNQVRILRIDREGKELGGGGKYFRRLIVEKTAFKRQTVGKMETFRRYSKRVYIPVYSKRHTTGRLIFLRFFKVPLRAGELFFPLRRLFFSPFLSFSTLQSTVLGKARIKRRVRVYFFFLEINFSR